MSEYQYYEFLAIDRPLTPKQMAELRARSSRASITPTSFVNDYQWGNLKGDPLDWMRRYFDAHVYVANWCTCHLFLRVPREVFNTRTLRAFSTEFAFTVDRTETHWILEWGLKESDNYDRFGEEDGRGWMNRLAPLRDELLSGDMRPLYLGWLAGVTAREVADEANEPPPPPGLSRLTAAQRSLAEFLEVDEDLLTAAGGSDQSAPELHSRTHADLISWIAELPVSEKDEVLKLILTGQARQAERQLKSRFLAGQWEKRANSGFEPPTRTVAELRTLAASAAEVREKQEELERNRVQAERHAQREIYLRTLATDFDGLWKKVGMRADDGIASAYDEVTRTLLDLADAHALCASRVDFDGRLVQFMSLHGKRVALVRRLVEAGLWKKSPR